jgi:hypothetical protein
MYWHKMLAYYLSLKLTETVLQFTRPKKLQLIKASYIVKENKVII